VSYAPFPLPPAMAPQRTRSGGPIDEFYEPPRPGMPPRSSSDLRPYRGEGSTSSSDGEV
jgi:hypothetical protein